MNRLFLLILGIFAAFAFGWVGMVAVPYAQIGTLQPEVNEDLGDVAPPTPSGLALAGERVYAANGCVYCHTQSVREGSDIERKWGERRSVARDYIYRQLPLLGSARFGQDLANIGTDARQTDPKWHHLHLYNPQAVYPWSTMPASRYLYITRKISGQKSDDALDLKGDDAPAPGYEVVPTEDAKALVAYLLSLRQNYPLKEAPLP